jgi:hypothetical protein
MILKFPGISIRPFRLLADAGNLRSVRGRL